MSPWGDGHLRRVLQRWQLGRYSLPIGMRTGRRCSATAATQTVGDAEEAAALADDGFDWGQAHVQQKAGGLGPVAPCQENFLEG